ncbi:hypothetical protein L0664_04945 [Octadecabacter sp. G9-8]|uniref:Uncharacterized protein n=1 Tax=Octadecabacter dasysiphoniae TaxID=2909341 RepID=A0ABS9CW59_9RHOB|nr:hypothetical protein [Octadecabacter dasysiphoniae]MCF2870406.1 hypothetical protein [Octadecabacter dasysiphoniae]
MSQLYLYNWTPTPVYVRLNGLDGIPGGPIKGSVQKYSYYPFSTQLPRDLTETKPDESIWGKLNDLTLTWGDREGSDDYRDLSDPTGDAARDLYLWIMIGQVMFSQGNTWLRKNNPSVQ